MSNYAIGIDLGTTYSCVGVWQGGQVHIIPNAQGNNTTPSYVAFKGDERLIGDAAKKHASINSSNTIFDAKRLIGRRFDDEQIQRDIKQWPFKVISDGNDNYPKIQVEIHENVKKEFFPEQISSMVLERMKEIAEAFLGEKVKDAVITVPAYFNDAQRHATKAAGAIAGLNILRIINEPTAAALAYGLEKNIEGERNVLVFDFGGGTLDVSVLSIKEGSSFDVKSTSGNIHLGGEDFDAKLVDHLCEEFKSKFDKDVKENPRALSKLRAAAVQVKHDLSSSTQASVIIDALMDGIDFNTEVSRVEFEELCADIFTKAFEPVERALEDAGIDKMSIDDVVLVGGSTRIPKIQSMLQNFFCGKKLNASMNPDEAVAYGAAVQAAMLSEEGKKSEILQAVRLTDVIPLSLGTAVEAAGLMSVVIKRNTKIPCKHREVFQTMCDNQTVVNVSIYEGERPLVKDNNFLGSFLLTGISPAPAGVTKIYDTWEIDADGILHVTAEEETSGSKNSIMIENNEERWSKERTDYMISEAEKYKSYDENQRNVIEAKHDLESYISLVKQAGHDISCRLTKAEKKQINKIFSEALMWLKSNRLATAEDYKEKLNEMEEKCTEIMARKERETALAKSQLNEYISSMKNGVRGNNDLSFDQNTQNQIMKICESADKWLDDNERAEKDDYVGVLEEIKRRCDSIILESRDKVKKSWFSWLNPNHYFF